ncbi:hypothetical protein SAMN05216311_1082 [Chitinophaga sp. CF418]|nr:hypothetical protein SAMN05216311_1082 [Chitinophaga sp. CF418]
MLEQSIDYEINFGQHQISTAAKVTKRSDKAYNTFVVKELQPLLSDIPLQRKTTPAHRICAGEFILLPADYRMFIFTSDISIGPLLRS